MLWLGHGYNANNVCVSVYVDMNLDVFWNPQRTLRFPSPLCQNTADPGPFSGCETT